MQYFSDTQYCSLLLWTCILFFFFLSFKHCPRRTAIDGQRNVVVVIALIPVPVRSERIVRFFLRILLTQPR